MDANTISAVMSHLSRRRTKEQRKGPDKLGNRCPCGKFTLKRAIARGHVLNVLIDVLEWSSKPFGDSNDSYTCKMYVECKGD